MATLVSCICLCMAVLLERVNSTVMTSPLGSNIYTPDSMYRMSVSKSLAGSVANFNISYTASPFKTTPQVLYSIVSMNLVRNIDIDITITVGLSSVVTQLMFDSSIVSLKLSYLIIDSTLYPLTMSYFTYNAPNSVSGVQTIVVTNHQQHSASFLKTLVLRSLSTAIGYAPTVDSISQTSNNNIASTTLTITYDPSQITIYKLTLMFVDFSINLWSALPNKGFGQQFVIYGTNGIVTDLLSTPDNLQMYPNNYFVGLQIIFDAQFIFPTLKLDIENSISTNMYYYVSELIFVAYHCPNSFPIIKADRTLCYSGCESGFYSDDQSMCLPCDVNCLTCIDSATKCQACNQPLVLSYGYVCSCPSSMLQISLNNGTLQCQPCSTFLLGCYSCTSQTVCTACQNNLILQSNACICPASTNQLIISTEHYCIMPNHITENCLNGFTVNGNICECSSLVNKTLINGVCF